MEYQVEECGCNHKIKYILPAHFEQHIQVVGVQMRVQICEVDPPTPLNTGTSGSESPLLLLLQFEEVKGHLVCDPLAVQQNEGSS